MFRRVVLALASLGVAVRPIQAAALSSSDLKEAVPSIWSTAEGLPAQEVRAIAKRPAGGFWVATTGGLASWTGTALEPIPTPPGFERAHGVVAMAADASGQLWMVSTRGQPLCLRAERFVDCLGRDDQIRDDAPLADLVADRKTVWFAAGDVIYRFADGSLSWTSSYPRQTAGPIHKIHAASDGRMFIAAENGLFIRSQDGEIKAEPLKLGDEPVAPILSVASGRQGKVLLGGINVLVVIGQANLRSVRLPEDGPAARFTTIFEDTEGTVWAGSSEGMARWRPESGQPVRLYTSSDGTLPDKHVTAIFQDDTGALWVGTHGAGLVRFSDPPPSAKWAYVVAAVAGLVVAALLFRRRTRPQPNPQ
jgi:ligand-binding sensor domain-containing protein